ncbi:sulfate permease, SulP family [Pseudomonas cuatrocienegasensis]|uniref:Sulfate permease, SulP family n=1 Tax=Pseudomonas cuatrocienegasensis TaxID=543360 RepID=A0ABY1BLU9_9PSED|nr:MULTISPECIES: sulfate permease [Pseudomonas]OEC35243.1 sodium-independent anion transporter [Pseudomonas sp. 21C1]SER15038.1 sulfate permease, SulP family [Pseudomonas cuatrocienegasensis]
MKRRQWLPCLDWAQHYSRSAASQDGLAALIVTLMLIPQSLAYAMLAGLPPIMGLYASILPLLAYALFGSSRTLAVGPVAVVSLMTAAALEPLFPSGSAAYIGAAMLLALLSGVLLSAMAVLRLGFLANFLSHPVVSGFISASGILIAIGQLKHLFGISVSGDSLVQIIPQLWLGLPALHGPTLLIGVLSLAWLWWARVRLKPLLQHLGLTPATAGNLAKAGPVLAIIVAILAVTWQQLEQAGVKVVGAIPQGLPGLTLPTMDLDLALQLLPAALLISLVGFVESVSVGQTLAAKRRQRIQPDNELLGLGTANLASAFSGGFPVTGGFARSVVNYDAGAQTPMAGVFTAAGIAFSVLLLTPLLHNLPHAVLAATIIVAVLSLVDLGSLRRTWRYSRPDGAAQLATLLGVLLMGVETGILLGVGLSLLLFLWRTSQPHMAVVGQVPGSEHFRNVERFAVIESPSVLSLRVDESLYFPNARYLEDRIGELIANRPQVRHLVLMCSGVNLIDASALDSLEAIVDHLQAAGVQLHLSEVKGPVMDQLRRSSFLEQFGGQVFISQFQALQTLAPHITPSVPAIPLANRTP